MTTVPALPVLGPDVLRTPESHKGSQLLLLVIQRVNKRLVKIAEGSLGTRV